ncbi:hypothetical protein RvY_14559-2 [Ramazzottius varieornatus]|uniref:Probable ATP-dependent RNA helicase spindle-E n=1 Tax=Ramazzottius varieornatus TaxID=947166 RepID=A0A1D1W063_RAMVA|nr:hypothetical protein RvY_14559-2 [Ramazzottius varieornatus]
MVPGKLLDMPWRSHHVRGNMDDQRLVWNPVVHDPLSARPRTPYTLFAEISGMNELCREAKEHLTQLKEKEANDLTAAEKLEEGEEATDNEFAFRGYTFLTTPIEVQPWYHWHLQHAESKSEPFVPKDGREFHFSQPERSEEEIRELDKTRLFAQVDYEAPLEEVPVDLLDESQKLSHDLYAEFDDLNLDEDAPGRLPNEYDVLQSQSGSGGGRPPPYKRFYDFSRDLEYDASLSVTHSRQSVLDSVRDNRVTIIVGPTGTGKTTQIPLFIMDALAKDNRRCNIVVTQPRRLAAVTNATRVASLRRDTRGRQWRLGHLVGYHVGMNRMAGKWTSLTFCTTAIFLKAVATDLNLGRYTHIILDEVHERDQDTDLCLMLVKKMMTENSPHVKLIIMSATMNLQRITEYFTKSDAGLAPAVVTLNGHVGRPITEYFLDDVWPANRMMPLFTLNEPVLIPEVAKFAFELLAAVANKRQANIIDRMDARESRPPEEYRSLGSVLVFLPGWADIQDFRQLLEDGTAKHGIMNWEVLVLHSNLSYEIQDEVMHTPSPDVFRIILSTNIAESSITIPYIEYVLDFALTKRLVVDPMLDLPRLAAQWTAKANMTQRKGRTGRVQKGEYFCMVPRRFYKDLLDHELPDITVAPIHYSILHVKVLNLPRVWKPHDLFSLLLDPPTRRKVDLGILQLKEVGALSLKIDGAICVDNGELTQIGRILEGLPISINLGRLIVYSYVFGVLNDGINLAAGLSVRKIFQSVDNLDMRFWLEKRVKYRAELGCDNLAVLTAWDLYDAAAKAGTFRKVDEEQWCRNNQLSYGGLHEMKYLRDELQDRLEKMGMYDRKVDGAVLYGKAAERADILRLVMAASFYPSFFVQDRIDSRIVTEEIPYTDPQLSLNFTHLPPNYGPLYDAQLMKIVDPLTWNHELPPEITYLDDKAYVTFNRHTLSSFSAYGAAIGVHLALRSARSFGQRPALMFLVPPAQYLNEIDKRTAEWKQTRDIRQFFLAKARDRRTPVIPLATGLPEVQKCDGQRVDVAIENIATTDRISLRLKSNADLRLLLRRKLQEYYLVSKDHYLPNPTPGDYAVAYHRELKRLERVQIIQRQGASQYDGSLFRVFCVDSGEYLDEVSERRGIRTIPPFIASCPAQVFEFRLAGIHIREVMERDVAAFISWLGAATSANNAIGRIEMEVYSVVNSVVYGTLFVTEPSIGYANVNLNEELVKLGFASFVKESYLSESCHTNEFSRLTDGPARVYVTVPSELQRATKKSELVQGPYSPITARFHSPLQQLSSCNVRCSIDSVNHRVLDGRPEATDFIQRILVASSVEQAEKKPDTITLRNSTLLPRQPGLLGILVALFAPCVELKNDKRLSTTGYTGAVAGIGFAPSDDGKKALSLYPDHDMRVQFDTALTPVDVEAIDDLRIMINSVLRKIQFGQRGRMLDADVVKERAFLQTCCKNSLFEILFRPRKTCADFATRQFATGYQWDVKSKPFQSSQSEEGDVFLQPIYLSKLPNFEKTRQEDRKREKSWKLYLDSVRFTYDSRVKLEDRVDKECPICGTYLANRLDVLHHMQSALHKAAEKLLEKQK